ncbi:MAG: type II toxin-antitoxin system VapC family toxin [Acidobacteria bacterium]|nr:type II toxin-antitoxin system VapC family toxin [Acidobacteriota bacterium]
MRLLLDSQAFLWWRIDDPQLSRVAERVLRDTSNQVFFSAASAWELAIKSKSGKLKVHDGLIENLGPELESEGFEVMPITLAHALRAASLPIHHRDPFDRMLVAQTQIEDLAIVSNDAIFDAYRVRRLW